MSVPKPGDRIGCLTCTESLLKRREFIRTWALSLFGISLSRYLQAKSVFAEAGIDVEANATAKSCILVWLDGGPSHVDMWDPKAGSSFKPISTNVPGIQVSSLLPRMARRMDKVSIIRSMHTEENNHGQGTYYALTGHRPTAAMQFPSFGTIVTRERGPRNHVPAHVAVPGYKEGNKGNYMKGAFLDARYDPMVVGTDPNSEGFQVQDLSLPKAISPKRLEDRRSLLALMDETYRRKMEMAEAFKMDSFTEQAVNMVLSPEVREAFDLSKESEKTRDAYGRTGFGQSLLLSRRLVEAGSRFVTAAGHDLNGWDTHADNDKKHRDNLVPGLERSLPVLLDDLEARGLLESTLVLVMGEFGRTPRFNSKGGRDHWPHCWSMILGGGGVEGGKVVGASDERGAFVAERMVSMGDVHATVYKAFGIDWTKEYMSPIGRPIKIANSIDDTTGQPVHELI